ncbi:UNVERIFIED_CONTAM: hypothetical protein Sradi_2001100 [Sesamum radiatum]|uniref:CCHC-type domain-containing protein n=1 Tax=Sesamum radiatum TaxID=300843 RepID=A0AAW2TFB6_SESRA
MTIENEVRTGGKNIGDESGSTSDDEEIDVVDNEEDLDEHRDSDENDGDGGTVVVFNPEDTYDPTFELGMRFSNKNQAYRAKRATLKEIEKSPDYQYTRLWDYAEEVRATNPGSTVILVSEKADDGEHRFSRMNVCFGVGFRGLTYKNALWKAAKACTVIEFKKAMQEMKGISQAAFDWFNNKPHTQWSRSHFSELPVCDMLLNNVCETFNACILDAREKSILTMLEWIREYLMRRMQDNRDRAIIETFKSVYQPLILPMTHESLWVESFIIRPLPPNYGRGPGRPSKARRREADEPRNKKKKKRGLQKLKRIQKTVHCTSCGEPGHNSAKCPEREPTEDTAGNQHNRKGSNANHPTILPPVHEDIHEEDAFEDVVITQEWHDVTTDNPIYRSVPSMYD